MIASNSGISSAVHSHVFLGDGHETSERKTWAVISICGAMMVAEIVGGLLFGSIALVADGMHMSTHAGALLLAALAYTYARRHAYDSRFTFGTGKFGDLAGFTSAIILAMISLLIGYESVSRIFAPIPIDFTEAIPIACLGLAVNIASAWLLSGGDRYGHHHGNGHNHVSPAHVYDREGGHRLPTDTGVIVFEIFEADGKPRFRLWPVSNRPPSAADVSIETVRTDGTRQLFTVIQRSAFLESVEEIPEPHAFNVSVRIGARNHDVAFEEPTHVHGATLRDNNMRAALVHVVADAAVSVLVIAGLILARAFGWLWMDPFAGIIGAGVIASWSLALIRDTGAILLDMNPDRRMTETLRRVVESDGDQLADVHLWRLGPGHLGAILCVVTGSDRDANDYRRKLTQFRALSHLTIEVRSSKLP